MRPETLFWLWLKSQLVGAQGFVFERIENTAGSNTPDIAFSWAPNTNNQGGHGWIELKCKKLHNKNKIIKIPHFTMGQRLWLRERGNKGGHCFLFLELGDKLMLFSHDQVLYVGNEILMDLQNRCLMETTKKTFVSTHFLNLITMGRILE